MKEAASIEKLSGEWRQVQIASSIEDVKRAPFALDSNVIVFRNKLEGDYDELTQYLLDRLNVQEEGSVTFSARGILKDDLGALSEEGQKAALGFFNSTEDILGQVRSMGARITVQGAQYDARDSNDYYWHTDGRDGRRIIQRVTGGMTEIAHVDDVLEIRRGAYDGRSDVIDNPRILTFNLGDIFANKAGQIGLIQQMKDRYVGRIDAVTHRKAEPTGKPGMIFTVDLPK